MVKKLVLASLVLALALVSVAPATVMAKRWNFPGRPVARHFEAVLTPTSIDSPVVSGASWPTPNPPEANSWPIVDLVDVEGVPTPTIVGWVVDGRSIYGGVTGDITGGFTFTYGGILDTLQSGSIQGIVTIQTAEGVLYLATSGSLEAEVIGAYLFEEIAGWWYSEPVQSSIEGCPLSPCPLWVFFVEIYNNDDLTLLPDEVLAGLYGDVLPPLPKTLSAEFSGTVRVDAGTGVYSSVSGNGRFKPAGGDPLTLHIYPNQHVHAIEGAIMLTGQYNKRQLRQPIEFDRDKLRQLVDKWQGQHGKD